MKKMNKPKGYAYGSMVRKPMYGGGMAMSANPMMDRKNKMGMMGMADGGKLKMVEKNGNKVPFFAADGEGKMVYGGKMKKKKMA